MLVDPGIVASFVVFSGGIIAAATGAIVAHKLRQSVETPDGVPEIGQLVPEMARTLADVAAWMVEHDAKDDRVNAWAGVPAHVLAPPRHDHG